MSIDLAETRTCPVPHLHEALPAPQLDDELNHPKKNLSIGSRWVTQRKAGEGAPPNHGYLGHLGDQILKFCFQAESPSVTSGGPGIFEEAVTHDC